MNCEPFLLCGTGLSIRFPKGKCILTIVQGYHRNGEWGPRELSPLSFEGILFLTFLSFMTYEFETLTPSNI